MKNLSANVIEILVNCIYTSEVGDLITEDNVQDVLEAANFLELLHVQLPPFNIFVLFFQKCATKMSDNLDLCPNSMRREGLLTDITLVTSSGYEIQAHKIILASRSRYFYIMFTAGKF